MDVTENVTCTLRAEAHHPPCVMESAGFCVNREGLRAYGAQLTEVAGQLSERIRYYAGGDFNINSTKQLGEVLFERLGLPHGKKTKTGYSTNAEVLEKLRPVHPIVDDILDYRQLTKLNSTYAEGLVKEIESDGRIRTVFKQTGTATGRLPVFRRGGEHQERIREKGA